MGRIKLAAANMAVRLRDPEANRKKLIQFVHEAGAAGVDFLVLPEVGYQGYIEAAPIMTTAAVDQKRYYRETAETVPGPLTNTLQGLAQEYNMYIQVGLAERALYGEVIYNTAAIVGPTNVEGIFRKVHNQFEFPFFNPGNDIPVVQLPFGRVGPFICYDLAFPELNRAQALKGAEIAALTTAWPMRGFDPDNDAHGYAYDVMSRANALFNQVWLVSSNHCEKRDDVWYYGHSRIIAPDGYIVAELKHDEGLVTAEVDLQEEITRARTDAFFGLNLLQDRHPELYGLIADTRLYYNQVDDPGNGRKQVGSRESAMEETDQDNEDRSLAG